MALKTTREARSRSAPFSPRRLDEWLPIVSVPRLRDRARSTFWIVPTSFVLASIALAAGLIALDHHVGSIRAIVVYQGPASGARSFLSSIVTSMITVTGTVFSVSVLVLQLTNTQFSSRAIPIYLRDRTVQSTLGLFMATFVYALVVQRSVGQDGGNGFVPRVAVTVAFLFVLASVGLFIRYISHISDMVRVATLVKTIAQESRQLLERRYPPDAAERRKESDVAPACAAVTTPEPGVLVSVNERRMIEIGCEHDCVLAVASRVGDFLPAGAILCRIHPGPDCRADDEDMRRSVEHKVRLAIAQDHERTMEQDLAFGLRQLVDIAEKALSPSLNDPTTATQCLDSLHDLLRRLATRRLPDGQYRDGEGRLRAVIPQYRFEDYLEVGLAEIWHYGREGTQIPQRVAAIVADLQTVARPEHRPALENWHVRASARGG